MSDGASTPSGTDSLTQSDAASLFEKMIDGEDGPTDEPEAPAAGADDDEPDPTLLDDAEPTDEDVDDDGDEPESDEDTPGDESNRTFTVTIDGKEEQVTLEELQKGYSRTKVFTQRTQEAAEIRKAAEAERAKIAEERAIVAQLAEQFQKALVEAEPEPDWEELERTDPMEWTFQRQKWLEKRAEADRAKAVQAELERRNAELMRASLEETLTTERSKLLEKVPEWADESKAKSELAEIRAGMLAEYGYTDEEAAQIYDHRAVLALRDAVRYRKLMKRHQELKASGKVVVADPAKTLRPTAGSKPTKGTVRREAMDSVRKTGRVEDAASAFLKMGLV